MGVVWIAGLSSGQHRPPEASRTAHKRIWSKDQYLRPYEHSFIRISVSPMYDPSMSNVSGKSQRVSDCRWRTRRGANGLCHQQHEDWPLAKALTNTIPRRE